MHADNPDQAHAIKLDEAAADLVHRWRHMREAAGRARAAAEGFEQQLLKLLGSADMGTVDGAPVVYREVRVRPGIDLARLRLAHPELWTEYATQRARTRLVPSPP